MTLQKPWPVDVLVPAPKIIRPLPVVLSSAEVVHFLACVPGLKHRAVLTTCHAAGLRIAEAIRLTLSAIDSQIVADTATFTTAYLRLGTSPDGGGTFFLPRLVGPSKALEIFLLRGTYSAADALRLGFVPTTTRPSPYHGPE